VTRDYYLGVFIALFIFYFTKYFIIPGRFLTTIKVFYGFVYGIAAYINPAAGKKLVIQHLKLFLQSRIFFDRHIYMCRNITDIILRGLPAQCYYIEEGCEDSGAHNNSEFINKRKAGIGNFITKSTELLRTGGRDREVIEAVFGKAFNYLRMSLYPLWEEVFKEALIAAGSFSDNEKDFIKSYNSNCKESCN